MRTEFARGIIPFAQKYVQLNELNLNRSNYIRGCLISSTLPTFFVTYQKTKQRSDLKLPE